MERIKILAITAVLTLNLTLCLSVQAQTDPDPGGTGGSLLTTTQDPDPAEDLSGTPDPGNSVPVDGGLSLLLAAGAAYGAGRLRRRAKGKDIRND